MKRPALPAQEEYRLSTLHALGLLDTPPDERFDAITKATATLFGTLCALDRKCRMFTPEQRTLLDQLGKWAEAEISLIAERLALPRYLGHLLGLLTEPVVLADADGRVQFANAAASSLLGYRPEELSGLPLTALIHESEREKFVVELAALERVPSDFASLEHSAAVLCKNGTRLAVMLTLSRRIAVTRSVTTMVLRQL
ncbi:MAG: hypothetical protein A2V78_03455 [Betaproteobacteria bacterium RBG_16_64_18]|nr:MAG: hypothetical protein A2V78_03455 [Betaproteobacteria bacterium RBG_16_64_18]